MDRYELIEQLRQSNAELRASIEAREVELPVIRRKEMTGQDNLPVVRVGEDCSSVNWLTPDEDYSSTGPYGPVEAPPFSDLQIDIVATVMMELRREIMERYEPLRRELDQLRGRCEAMENVVAKRRGK
jgi:hypothetical protein